MPAIVGTTESKKAMNRAVRKQAREGHAGIARNSAIEKVRRDMGDNQGEIVSAGACGEYEAKMGGIADEAENMRGKRK